MSIHPAHLISPDQYLNPSALIPLCAYQTDVTLVGKNIPDIPFPICSKFYPTLLEGELCYVINISSLTMTKTKEGLRNGLLLVLDLGNPDTSQESMSIKHNFQSINLEPESKQSSLAKIYLNTLARFTSFKSGTYAMSALKQMTGTDSFLALPVGQKKCQIETFEACWTKTYVELVQSQCGCVPWALFSALSLEKPTFCSPDKSACYTAVSSNITGCMVSCTGLYADIDFTEDRLLAKDHTEKGNGNMSYNFYLRVLVSDGRKEIDRDKLFSMLETYKQYKSKYAQNIVFDSEQRSLSMKATITLAFIHLFSATTIEENLQLIQIFFDTATFDEIERDVKVTLEAQLGLIGGTMGLLTGFSILSGVEIVYYLIKFFMSLKTSRLQVAQGK